MHVQSVQLNNSSSQNCQCSFKCNNFSNVLFRIFRRCGLTVALKARRVGENHGLDLDLRVVNLMNTEACLSSIVSHPRDVGGLVMRRDDCRSQRKGSMSTVRWSVSVFNVGIGIRYFVGIFSSRFGIRYRYFNISRYRFGISVFQLVRFKGHG